jgi:threonine synthase
VVELVNATNGSVEAIEDEVTAAAIRDVARLEGIYPETAGGVTLGAIAAARRRGVIGDGDEVVALLTGNGLKTPDARTFGRADGVARPGEPGLAPVIRPSLSAFEAWLDGSSGGAA